MSLCNLALLGSTGSIGKSALAVARALPDRIRVSLLAAGRNWELLAEQAREFHPDCVCLDDAVHLDDLRAAVPAGCKVISGREALCEAVAAPEITTVLCAIVGTGGLFPTLSAIRAHKTIALASKEVMVMAGRLVTDEAKANNARILPVDSEHSALFQCLEGRRPSEVAQLILTASGGPFRNTPVSEMDKMTWEQALAHPTWSMGPKVTVDSASLMNKALEMIEARWLFDVESPRIEVLVHPQSIVHSLVRFRDGALMAQMSRPDMRFPIQYALTWPEHTASNLPALDLAAIGELTFEHPDESRFPSLGFARAALEAGGALPAILNAANEVAFERFRAGTIRFPDIWRIVERTMDALGRCGDETLDAVLEADARAREYARGIVLPGSK
ncbi:MAG: 1-deoxy-D-xylulose-5-phosphate reductoisomerase [Lentisphaeria bacterium]|nr:1-deoxy-D-xylulose-5-phosphate reductoisomerase [Lentisphaeria bacterium]